jgi:carbon-monoxide dehydrogenase large subunit
MERLMDTRHELDLMRRAAAAQSIPAAKMPYKAAWQDASGRDHRMTAAIIRLSGGGRGRRDWDASGPAGSRPAQGRLIGLAHAMKGTGRGPFESGVVRISPSGRISVYTGATAMGQGLKTTLAQICASELGVAPDAVQVISGDTATVPVGLGGFASRQTVTAGSSVLLAARAVASKARKLASHVLELPNTILTYGQAACRRRPPAQCAARRTRPHPARGPGLWVSARHGAGAAGVLLFPH